LYIIQIAGGTNQPPRRSGVAWVCCGLVWCGVVWCSVGVLPRATSCGACRDFAFANDAKRYKRGGVAGRRRSASPASFVHVVVMLASVALLFIM
jgi:hypothetical protein